MTKVYSSSSLVELLAVHWPSVASSTEIAADQNRSSSHHGHFSKTSAKSRC